MRRLARDVGTLCRHDYGIGGGSVLCVGPALLSMPELRDTEETYLYQRISQPRPLPERTARYVPVGGKLIPYAFEAVYS